MKVNYKGSPIVVINENEELVNLKKMLEFSAPKVQIQECSRLKSKKNDVFLLNLKNSPFAHHDKVIFKKYNTAFSLNEEEILTKLYCSKVSVPKILKKDKKFLVLEYIDGQNLCDVVNSTLDPKYIRMLAQWLANFHQTFSSGNGQVTLRGDSRLRNFVIKDDKIFGIDFEESEKGYFVKDVAEMAGSIFDTHPGLENPLFFPTKLKFISEFLKAYVATRNNPKINDELHEHFVPFFIQTLKETADRRKYWDNVEISNILQTLFQKLMNKEIDLWNV